jgi:hypothetical protein
MPDPDQWTSIAAAIAIFLAIILALALRVGPNPCPEGQATKFGDKIVCVVGIP